MVSTHPLISKSSSLCTSPLVTVPSAPITIGITVTFMFHRFFSSLARSRNSPLFSLSFSFTQWSAGTVKVHCSAGTLFFLLTITRSGRLAEIRWSFFSKILEKFVCLIFQDGFWFVQIPFVRIVKFKLLAQFLVDHLPHPVVSSLIFFLR